MRALRAVLLVALLAGCAAPPPDAPTPRAADAPGGAEPRASPLDVVVAHAERATAAGHDVAFLVQVRGLADAGARVVLEGEGASGEAVLRPGAGGVFVPVRVAPDAPAGLVPLAARVEVAGGPAAEVAGAATLRVLAPQATSGAPPEHARVFVTLRYADSQDAVSSNEPALEDASFPRAYAYEATPGPLDAPRRGTIEGVFDALAGMQEGETRTVTIPPEKAYGEAVVREVVPRVERVPRTLAFVNPLQTMSRSGFDVLIGQSGQGDPATFEGRTFRKEDAVGIERTYVVRELGETIVRYQLGPSPGERTTVYPIWRNASVVVSANETEVTYSTTPPVEPGARITWRSGWVGMTEVVEVGEDAFVLRHSPPVGLAYAAATDRLAVGRVDEERITLFAASPYRLSGHALTADVTLVQVLARP